MEGQYATKEELWRLQESLTDISSTQSQHADRIMRLEKRREDDGRVKNVWTPSSPFTGVLGSAPQHESTLNPTAEAFRNFDSDPPSGMMSSLTLDSADDGRRGVASRANSVRFDESANNHYNSSSRQSIDLPTRTGSGLGAHPLSERSLSHRSDGRPTTTGFPQRTNSFGLEQSKLLGSIHNSPRVTGNPPPGFSFLGPFPAIVRCWLTETFSHSSLLYAAICTGSMESSVSSSLLEHLRVSEQVFEENGLRKIRLPLYFTEARIQHASSRSGSPIGQVPSILGKFHIVEAPAQDITIQVIVGSDILRSRNADIMFSQERLVIFDEERNQLAVPLVRPENEEVYKNLATSSVQRQGANAENAANSQIAPSQSPVGIIGRPGRVVSEQSPASPPTTSSGSVFTSAAPSDIGESRKADQGDTTSRTSLDLTQSRTQDDSKSVTGSEKSFVTTPTTKQSAGVWSNSWRSSSGTGLSDKAAAPSTASSYARAGTGTGTTSRNMKILRPSAKTMSSVSRTTSSSATPPTTSTNGADSAARSSGEGDRKLSQTSSNDTKSAPTKANPVGSGSAFGWLNSGSSKKGVNGA